MLFLAPTRLQEVCRELSGFDQPPHLNVAQLYDGRLRRLLTDLTVPLVDQPDMERAELGVHRLVEMLWRHGYLETTRSPATRERGRKAVLAARDLIHASWNEHLPIATLTREVKLPLATLERAFHDVFGTSPRQYQLRVRLMRGKELFRNTGAPVAEVAKACGFRDPKYFSRLFKRDFGCQPSDYKRRAGAFT